MKTISLAMIVKNEEATLARCLDCVRDIVDEMIIVDTGSDDQTMAIAEQYGAQVYSFAWQDDFAAARNYAFSFAQMEYTLWLDADDIITREEQEKLLAWKQDDTHPDIVMMKYDIGFDESGNATFSYYRERLLKTSCHFSWVGAIHEAITPQGNVQYTDISVSHHKVKPHDSDRNLRIFEQMRSQGKTFSPREQYYYGRELYYHERYQEAVCEMDRFLASKQGWIENCIDACRLKGMCYLALQEREKAFLSLTESFIYDTPRAEILCDMGYLFYEIGRYHQAIYWYERALNCVMNRESGAFVEMDCYGFLPYLQLSVCYERIGKHDLACMYHQKAKALKPNHPLIVKNDPYFKES